MGNHPRTRSLVVEKSTTNNDNWASDINTASAVLKFSFC